MSPSLDVRYLNNPEIRPKKHSNIIAISKEGNAISQLIEHPSTFESTTARNWFVFNDHLNVIVFGLIRAHHFYGKQTFL